ncbi:DUF4126 family protein [Novosphingobium sp. FGD1]|uniref:DUF4126 family protein n=1 Tax=Novosphingobium silvae TaxID=2692619 RepID=A0A7X4GH59_9SPHN|nr:DUF4126 family protein [Novosphingobium silvae]MYL98478.1 DUF4126 family protein [Novosphingobium silvae]
MILLLALAMGIIAGLRAFTPPAAISWAAWLGVLDLGDTGLAFLGYRFTPWILTLVAALELVGDQLPRTPSRKVPSQFGARLISGAFCGAAIGLPSGAWVAGLVAGLIGAAIGTYGGAALRAALARSLRSDRPAGLIEDVLALVVAILVVQAL